MQKSYKGNNLSLGTWPTSGVGFDLAVDAWRKFVKGLAAMEDLGTSPDDERVKQLVVDAREAAKLVRLALN